MTIDAAAQSVHRRYMAHMRDADTNGDTACATPYQPLCPRGQQLWDDTDELLARAAWAKALRGRDH